MAGSKSRRRRRRIILRLFHFIVAVGICLLAGYLGSRIVTPNLPWYNQLVKPSLTPPSGVFAPVWTFLYVCMGIGLFVIWRQGIDFWKVRVATVLFLIQLAINVFWNHAFFGMHSPLFGLVVIGFLWIFVAWTILTFGRLSKPAAWWLVPYLAWISFALILNAGIFARN